MAVLNRESLTIVSVDGSEGRRTVLEPPPSQANPTLSWSPLPWSPDGHRPAIADGRRLHVLPAARGRTDLPAGLTQSGVHASSGPGY